MCQQSITNYHYLLNCQEGILTQVTLGSARFSDCRNFGICRMNLIPEVNTRGCRNCLDAYLRLDIPTGRLLLHFISASVDQKVYQRFFGKATFLMEEDFYLPEGIARKLNFIDHPIIIERGNYPVLNDGQFLTLSLRKKEVDSLLEASAKL